MHTAFTAINSGNVKINLDTYIKEVNLKKYICYNELKESKISGR